MDSVDLVKAFAAGFGATITLFLIVWVSGATFGQRCEAKGFINGTDEFDLCVSRLTHGYH